MILVDVLFVAGERVGQRVAVGRAGQPGGGAHAALLRARGLLPAAAPPRLRQLQVCSLELDSNKTVETAWDNTQASSQDLKLDCNEQPPEG